MRFNSSSLLISKRLPDMNADSNKGKKAEFNTISNNF